MPRPAWGHEFESHKTSSCFHSPENFDKQMKLGIFEREQFLTFDGTLVWASSLLWLWNVEMVDMLAWCLLITHRVCTNYTGWGRGVDKLRCTVISSDLWRTGMSTSYLELGTSTRWRCLGRDQFFKPFHVYWSACVSIYDLVPMETVSGAVCGSRSVCMCARDTGTKPPLYILTCPAWWTDTGMIHTNWPASECRRDAGI